MQKAHRYLDHAINAFKLRMEKCIEVNNKIKHARMNTTACTPKYIDTDTASVYKHAPIGIVVAPMPTSPAFKRRRPDLKTFNIFSKEVP